MGGGELPALSWKTEELPSYAHTGEVDTVDGFVLALSPWAVRNVRFDESLGQLHGYDFDFCLPGSRGRPQGRHRRLHASSITTRWSWSATPRPGSRRTCGWPRSGMAACRRRREATGSSARGGPRRRPRSRAPRPSPRCCRPTPGDAARAGSRRGHESTSWRLTDAVAPAQRRAQGAPARDDRLRLLDHRRPRSTSASPSRASSGRRAGRRGARLPLDELALPLLQPDPRPGGRARGPRGARARPPGH